jgi:UbiD family decarboxylase
LPKDLRSFLQQLRAHPGELVEVERRVRPHEFEVTALLKQLEDRGRHPAVLFGATTDQYGAPSDFAILANLYASRRRCAIAFDADPERPNYELSLAYARKARETIAPVAIPPDEAPVRECVWQGSEADVGRLPIVRHFAMDMGPVLTMTHVMRSVDGIYDVSFAKTFYKWDPHEMVVSIHTRDLSRIVKEYEKRNESAPIVNVLGHHPAFHHGSLARLPWGVDDYARLGSFLGEPLRLTPSLTWGDRFMVPADAEMIIEGEIPPGARDVCDPFGEVPRLYQAQCLRPVFQVKAITFRRGAIIQDIFSGFRDSFPLNAVATEAALETLLRPSFPGLAAVHVPNSGSGLMAAYVAVRDIAPGQAEAIGTMVLEKTPVMHMVAIVDHDIDVFDEDEVQWAIHTYTNLDKGLNIYGANFAQHPGLNPNFAPTNWGGKMIVDATRPRDFAFGSRSEVPEDVIRRMPLDEYVAGPTLAAAK